MGMLRLELSHREKSSVLSRTAPKIVKWYTLHSRSKIISFLNYQCFTKVVSLKTSLIKQTWINSICSSSHYSVL